MTPLAGTANIALEPNVKLTRQQVDAMNQDVRDIQSGIHRFSAAGEFSLSGLNMSVANLLAIQRLQVFRPTPKAVKRLLQAAVRKLVDANRAPLSAENRFVLQVFTRVAMVTASQLVRLQFAIGSQAGSDKCFALVTLLVTGRLVAHDRLVLLRRFFLHLGLGSTEREGEADRNQSEKFVHGISRSEVSWKNSVRDSSTQRRVWQCL